MGEFFTAALKRPNGGEGGRCKYPDRLDTYGCGCQHNCSYCYARSLLAFRGLWNAEHPKPVDKARMAGVIGRIPRGEIVRLGGMTDCLMPQERELGVTLDAIRHLNDRGVGYLVVTKSALVADPAYMAAYDPGLAHFQISISSTDDSHALEYERCSSVTDRLRAYRSLQDAGFDVSLRASPYLPDAFDWSILGGHKVLVEFLRVNHWIEKWLPRDYSAWTLKAGGYRHLPLGAKVAVIDQIHGFDQISVCEDVDDHFAYWQEHVNANPDDCCNLRL